MWHRDVASAFYVTVVYGKSSRMELQMLWADFLSLSSVKNCPWLVGGDFNAILGPSEYMGNSIPDAGSMRDFGDFDLGVFYLKYINV